MGKVEVYDPHACGPPGPGHLDDDVAGCRLGTDLRWLGAQGVHVEHRTLREHPGDFVRRDVVRFLCTVIGSSALPVVLVDGRLRAHGRYPDRRELAAWVGIDLAAPDRAPAPLPEAAVPAVAPVTSTLPGTASRRGVRRARAEVVPAP